MHTRVISKQPQLPKACWEGGLFMVKPKEVPLLNSPKRPPTLRFHSHQAKGKLEDILREHELDEAGEEPLGLLLSLDY